MTSRSAHVTPCCLRPEREGSASEVYFLSRPPVGSLALRPGDSLAILWMALSVGFIRFVSSTDATQATRLLTLALVGLTPTEHASLRWTHWFVKTSSATIPGAIRPCLSLKASPNSVESCFEECKVLSGWEPVCTRMQRVYSQGQVKSWSVSPESVVKTRSECD